MFTEIVLQSPQILPQLAVQSVLFGIHTIITAMIAYKLLRSNRMNRRSGSTVLKGLCLAIYTVSAIHWAFATVFVYRIATACWSGRCGSDHTLDGIADPSLVSATPRVLLLLLVINIFLSDTIVIWRAWALWPRKRTIQGGLVLVGTPTFCLLIIIPARNEILNGVGGFGLLLSWAENVLCTGLIAWKTWKHRRVMKRDTRRASPTYMEKLLLLFVESGIVYSFIWTFIAYFTIYELVDENFVYRNPFFIGFTLFPLTDIVSIYPTAVVLLVDRAGSTYHRALRLESMPTPLAVLSSNSRDDVVEANGSATQLLVHGMPESPLPQAQEDTSRVRGIRYIPAASVGPSDSNTLCSAYCTEATAH
ncbi:hypothetical protein PsYK624_033360 [Phanerochaete sordida]|uniref:Uncharacterized protein n=1 Tax=Phanerochaete sordida TaxID=48140 RepID=A0A9P3LAR5_9APHY|nr:hypothetical protein PsYK624_033360 [Phanerochaete sordida]